MPRDAEVSIFVRCLDFPLAEFIMETEQGDPNDLQWSLNARGYVQQREVGTEGRVSKFVVMCPEGCEPVQVKSEKVAALLDKVRLNFIATGENRTVTMTLDGLRGLLPGVQV